MKLSDEYLKEQFAQIEKSKADKMEEYNKFVLYNGKSKKILTDAIKKEFKRPETIEELCSRIVPINIMQKIINKLSCVYNESPIRFTPDSDYDEELLEKYEDSLMINIRMREANRHFNIYKKTLVEIYIDKLGIPRLRALPAYSYWAFSSDPVSPEIPDCIVKAIKSNADKQKERYVVWTDEEHIITDGSGNKIQEDLMRLQNPMGVNPYGKMPFGYIVDSSMSTEPIQDDDLYNVSVCIPLLLSDLNFAIKYQAWSLIYTIDMGGGDIPTSPNTVVHMDSNNGQKKPEIGMVKPSIDIDATLRNIEAILSFLLSSKGLKTDLISGTLKASDPASGISKIIDNASLHETRKDQQTYFYNLEHQIWDVLKNNCVPYWKETNQLNKDIPNDFTEKFQVNINFKEPKTTLTEKEQIEISKLRIDNNFSTLKRELFTLYPDYTDEEVDSLIEEIQAEKADNKSSLLDEMYKQKMSDNQNKDENETGKEINESNGE
jgi:hypothetical protein